MMYLQAFDTDLCGRLCWTLLHSLWQGALLVGGPRGR
ncbi:hypothetical protein KOR34_05100 [Posidoniimonas corsicana]|uniref:Uncharacterized protein n=1 Tax=Posidoniimonas corsicana TaxID=1938618 RepID=A0A5C5VAJ2_9BACT|nr:hypothetical protein KOR34_05100 [Posidoniimonas corsicana]